MKLISILLTVIVSLVVINAAPIAENTPEVPNIPDAHEGYARDKVQQNHQLTRPSPINPDVISDPLPTSSEHTLLVTPIPDVKVSDWHRENRSPLARPAAVEEPPKEPKNGDSKKIPELKTKTDEKKRSARDVDHVKVENVKTEEQKPKTTSAMMKASAPIEIVEDKPKQLSRGSSKFGAVKPEPVVDVTKQIRPLKRSLPIKKEEKSETKIEHPQVTINEPNRPAMQNQAKTSEMKSVPIKENTKTATADINKAPVGSPKLDTEEHKRLSRNTPTMEQVAVQKESQMKTAGSNEKQPINHSNIKQDQSIKKTEVLDDSEIKRKVRASEKQSKNDDKNNDREEIINYPNEKYDNEGPHFSFPVPVSKILGEKAIKYNSGNQKSNTEGNHDTSPANEAS